MNATKACSRCGQRFPLTALGCSHCGQPFTLSVWGDVIFPVQKKPMRAFFLSFGVFAGLGQFYVGQTWKGLLWIVIAIVVGVPTLGIGTLAANLISGIDAFLVARKLSRGQPSGTWEWFPD